MADFSKAIEAQMRGATVRPASLVEFDFLSGTKRLWPGFGNLDAGGKRWEGIGNLGTISSVTSGPGLAVEEMTFQLFGDTRILENFSGSAEESAGREVNVYFQFFEVRQEDELGNWVEWQTLDEPFQLFWGRMGPLTAERPEGDGDAAASRAARVLSTTASNAFLNRARPAFGYYSDRDQKARHPGDNMFINAFRMADVRVRWPKF